MRRFSKIAFFPWVARVAWFSLATGTCILLVSAIRAKNNQKCKSLFISIDPGTALPCVQAAELHALLRERHLDPRGKNLRSVDASAIESLLESEPWISHAQVYLDNGNQMHIRATQRKALVRVFSTTGESYYLDSEGHRLPLPSQVRPAQPVFTSFPAGQNSVTDSLILTGVLHLGTFLVGNSFWNAQTEQVNIQEDGSFELIPRIGGQVILLGDGNNLPAKFNNLMAFYRQVLNVEGWEKYDTINLSYKNEIVAVRRPARKGQAATVPVAPETWAGSVGKSPSRGPILKKPDPPARQVSVQAGPKPKAIYTAPKTHHPSINTSKTN
ncbi:MAG TPA: hypothetical protein VMV20_00810 [Chitinophagaceae bacterium]|nr:hypothetical protein [Chitinophagaceae bacterium]